MALQLTQLNLDAPLSNAEGPKHQILKEYFARQIEMGQLKPGAILPTELELSSVLGVARSTVRRALRTLEQDGLIQRFQGKGTFVHKDANQMLQKGSALLALIVPETRTAYYPSLLHSFEEASREIQHQAIVCNTQNDIDIQGNTILQLIDKQSTGVAIVPTTTPLTPAYQIRQLHQNQIPVVFLHRDVKDVQAPLLKMPQEKMGYLAGKTFLEQGHRRVAYMASHISHSNDQYRLGLQTALQDAGSELYEENVWSGDSAFPDELKDKIPTVVKSLLTSPDRPTAIFASFDSVAELVYLELLKLGVRVPDDISLIGVGGTWRKAGIAAQMTSIVVDETAVGRRAVELLSEMRRGIRSLTNEEQFELPIALSNGQTLGRI